MLELSETCVEHLKGNDYISVTASETWSINLMKKLAQRSPEEVEIIHTNEDGSMLVHLPKSWLAIRPPKKMSAGHKARMVENLKRAREKRA